MTDRTNLQASSERAGVDALREALQLVVDVSKSGADTIGFLTELQRVAAVCAKALTTPPAQPAAAATHGDGYCGCTERCKDRDNCQYDVKPEDFNDQDEVLLAYGLLWLVNTTDKRVHSARRELLRCLSRELQAKAISAARTTMALVRDIRQMKGATFAADFDTHGKPDGAVRSDALADLYYAIGGLAALAAIGCDEVGRMTGDHVAVTQSMERRRDDALAALRSPRIAAAETSPGDVLAMKEALKPFADAASSYDEIPGVVITNGNVELWQQPNGKGYRLTVQNLRDARTAIDRLDVTPEAKSQEPEAVAFGMYDTQMGRSARLMMVRLCNGQDGCDVPIYAHPTTKPEAPAVGVDAIRAALCCPDGCCEPKACGAGKHPDEIAQATAIAALIARGGA